MKDKRIISLSQLSIGVIISGIFTILLKAEIWRIISEKYEYFLGLILMLLSALFMRYLLILIYDYIKIDWFSIENYKAGLGYKENHILRKLNKFKKLGWVGILIVLIILDPSISVIYYRPGYFDWNGIKGARTKSFFLFGNLLAVLTWGNFISLIF